MTLSILEPERVPPLVGGDPAERGPYVVRTLTYGSGENPRRPMYAESVQLRTEPVDASGLLPEWKGFRQRMRERYWGYGIDRYPVNGIVWAPEGDGPFPLVLVVHGNHSMEEFSDPGYAYLGEHLASRGFIVVSVDENLTNATWSGDFRGKEMPVRAFLLLKHLRQWREWNTAPDGPFSGRVDLENIGLIGHSRGGEAVAMATVFNRVPYSPDNALVPFDTGFGIEAVIAIAPTDHRYVRRMTVHNVNYMTVHGGYDTDVENFYGMRQYDRVRFSDGTYRFKFALYVHHANHGQFNTVWGREDTSPPRSWFLNTKPLITGADQRRIALIYVSGFLEATLRAQAQYLPMFRDPRTIAHWLPQTGYLHRFEDTSFRAIAIFEEDPDVTTSTVPGGLIRASNVDMWSERPLPFRTEEADQMNNGVILGWSAVADDSAVLAVTLPEGFTVSPSHRWLTFALTRTADRLPGDDEIELHSDTSAFAADIILEDRAGRTARAALQDLASIPGPFLTPLLLKTQGLSNETYGKTWEPILRTYAIPESAFQATALSFDWRRLHEIRFVFPKNQSSVVILDDIGLRSEYQP